MKADKLFAKIQFSFEFIGCSLEVLGFWVAHCGYLLDRIVRKSKKEELLRTMPIETAMSYMGDVD